jgi:fibronectin-binding autotransporter adhesin
MKIPKLPFRPLLEHLEERLTPAGNVQVSTDALGNLHLTGDALSNSVRITQTGVTTINVTGLSGTTINHSAVPFTATNFTGGIDGKMGGGDDFVELDLTAGSITVHGNMSLNFGAGNSSVDVFSGGGANTLTVTQNVAVHYGVGNVETDLDNIDVFGNLTVNHASGDSDFSIENTQGAGHFSTIGGSVSVTNTQGAASDDLSDFNIGGNATFNNGKANNATNATGDFEINNVNNTTTLSAIGGNLSVTYVNGNSYELEVGDVSVGANVTLNAGSANVHLSVAPDNTTQATVINGSLSINGTGADTVELGRSSDADVATTGLTVHGAVAITDGVGGDALTITDVNFLGGTSITTGAGNDTVTIDGAAAKTGSLFTDGFTMNTNGGNDTVTINAASGKAAGVTTSFHGHVSVNLGPGNDSLAIATSTDAGTAVDFFASSANTVFDGDGGHNVLSNNPGNEPVHQPTFLNFV